MQAYLNFQKEQQAKNGESQMSSQLTQGNKQLIDTMFNQYEKQQEESASDSDGSDGESK